MPYVIFNITRKKLCYNSIHLLVSKKEKLIYRQNLLIQMEIRWEEDQPSMRDIRQKLESDLIPELYSLAKKYSLHEVQSKLIIESVYGKHLYICSVYTDPKLTDEYYVSIKREDLPTVDARGIIQE